MNNIFNDDFHTTSSMLAGQSSWLQAVQAASLVFLIVVVVIVIALGPLKRFRSRATRQCVTTEQPILHPTPLTITYNEPGALDARPDLDGLYEHHVIAPVLSLSFDIMNLIFLDTIDYVDRGRTLKACSQVCRQWRNAVLSSSLLWAAILVHSMEDSERWVDEILRRSKTCALHIEAYLENLDDSSRVTTNVMLALKHIDRIHSFKMVTFLDTTLCGLRITANFPPVAPALRVLTICHQGFSYPDVNHVVTLDAPCLRSVTLEKCYFQWDHFRFYNLTYLSVTDTSRRNASLLSDLLAALSASPMLQELHLNPLTFDTSGTIQSQTPVSLRQMKCLALGGTISRCAALLSSLDIPSIEAFELHMTGAESPFTSPDFMELLSHVDLVCRGISINQLRLEGMPGCELFFFGSSRHIEHDPAVCISFDWFTIPFDEENDRFTDENVTNIFQLVKHFSSMINTENITSLDFDMDSSFASGLTVERWAITLSRFSAVKRVKFSSQLPCHFIRALYHTDTPILPLLDIITFNPQRGSPALSARFENTDRSSALRYLLQYCDEET
ncbi:hypothetical protein BJ138DRAFT_893921 [Hygrophoropsis aurantiaca]|uniref:Uncharacterized protein n=1 Tax=Hygrophoropsis aurantiaca TaxID=72124 RepID=A0ACB7ZTV1_9AGAM|nr:hypothetical protein BJ138DRAFT_893921 [Hygrophoropsis aurantiaca]